MIRVPDPNFLTIPDSGAKRHRIPDPQHCPENQLDPERVYNDLAQGRKNAISIISRNT
jgi:hypothetical protein